MRFVHVTAPAGKRRAIERILAEREIDYTVTDEVGSVGARPDDREYEAVVTFPLPVEAVEPVLQSLREIGIDEESHVVVQSVQTIVSDRFGELQREYDEHTPDERIAHEEIRIVAKDLMPDWYTYLLLVVASAVVATAGMLLDSASIVVGSMVIAPLVGPSLSASVGTVLDDRMLFRKAAKYQAVGFGLSVVSAVLFALVVRALFLVPPTIKITAIEQIAGRLSPDLLSLVVAVGSGTAGARSLTGGISTPLVGVMMAAALVPPTAAVGIGIAWVLPDVVFRAGLLVLVNAFSINLAAIATLWYSGYRANTRAERQRAEAATRNRMVILAVAVLVLAAVLGAFTYSAYRTGVSTEGIQADVESVLDEEQYANVTLTDVSVERAEGTFNRQPTRVVVTVTRPAGEQYPRLDEDIGQRLDSRLREGVETEVRFIPVQTTGDTDDRSDSVRPLRAASPGPVAHDK